MLTVFIATFVIFALVILGMSLGYPVKRKSIRQLRWDLRAGAGESLRLSATVRRVKAPRPRGAASAAAYFVMPGGAAHAGPAASVL